MTDEELIKRMRDFGHVDAYVAAARIEALLADRRFILDERDSTFALMLARTETAEADRDRIAAEWAEVSQKNYQQAKAAEARADQLEAALRALMSCVDDGCLCSEMEMATVMDGAYAALKGEQQ